MENVICAIFSPILGKGPLRPLAAEEAEIRHRLGLVLWQTSQDDLDEARDQLATAADLLESLVLNSQTNKAKDKYFDLQTDCYALLQRVLVALGRHGEALVVAEKARTRAVFHVKGSSSSDGVTSEADVVALVNRQKASVLYYSVAAGYLYR